MLLEHVLEGVCKGKYIQAQRILITNSQLIELSVCDHFLSPENF